MSLKKHEHFEIKKQEGFSVIEIMLVLALFILASTFIVINFDKIAESISSGKSIRENLELIIRTARYNAFVSHETVQLYYVPDKKSYVIKTISGKELKTIKNIGKKDHTPKEMSFYFLKDEKENRDLKIPYLTFSPDGSSEHAMIECKTNTYVSNFILNKFSNSLEENT